MRLSKAQSEVVRLMGDGWRLWCWAEPRGGLRYTLVHRGLLTRDSLQKTVHRNTANALIYGRGVIEKARFDGRFVSTGEYVLKQPGARA